MDKYKIVPVEDFYVLVDTSAKEKDLKKGDGILFTPSEGERKVFSYDESDGYGLGVYDSNNTRHTISLSRACKIVTVVGKTIKNIPYYSHN